MEIVVTIILSLLSILVVFLGVIALAVFSSIRGQLSPAAKMTLIDPERHRLGPRLFAAAEQADAWAEAHGYRWAGLFEFAAPGNPPAFVAAWSKGGSSEFFAQYLALDTAGKVIIRGSDFVNLFDQERSLNTSDTAATMLFPRRAGVYKQAFPKQPLDALAAQHRDALALLRAQMRVKDRNDPRPLEAVVLDSVRKSAEHVRTKALWPLRGVWWWLTQSARCNRSVAQQLARREI